MSTAKKLVTAFGETAFDTIEAEPGRLREVTGIGPVRAQRITDGWAEQKVVPDGSIAGTERKTLPFDSRRIGTAGHVLQPGWRNVLVCQQWLPFTTAAGDLPQAVRGGLSGRCSVSVG